MGFRLHCATVYKVQWGDAVGFNYKTQEFHNLLDILGCEYSGDEYDVDFEVCKDDWRAAIDKLKHIDSLPEGEAYDITECLEQLEYTADEVVERMETLLTNCEPDSGYLHLSFF